MLRNPKGIAKAMRLFSTAVRLVSRTSKNVRKSPVPNTANARSVNIGCTVPHSARTNTGNAPLRGFCLRVERNTKNSTVPRTSGRTVEADWTKWVSDSSEIKIKNRTP